jgi:hypothetical protein
MSPQEIVMDVILGTVALTWSAVGIFTIIQIRHNMRRAKPPRSDDDDEPDQSSEGDNYDPEDPGDWWKKRPKERVG